MERNEFLSLIASKLKEHPYLIEEVMSQISRSVHHASNVAKENRRIENELQIALVMLYERPFAELGLIPQAKILKALLQCNVSGKAKTMASVKKKYESMVHLGEQNETA